MTSVSQQEDEIQARGPCQQNRERVAFVRKYEKEIKITERRQRNREQMTTVCEQ